MPDHRDRLTSREADVMSALEGARAGDLTFNEVVAVAGLRLAETTEDARRLGRSPSDATQAEVDRRVDASRDLALAHTALENALTRFNSARYRMMGTWKRADPDALPLPAADAQPTSEEEERDGDAD